MKQERAETLKPQNDVVFALDIGTRTVVGIVGVQNEADGVSSFKMLDYVVEAHPKRAMIDGQIEDIRQVAKIVKKVKDQLQDRTGIKLEHVSIAAAGRALRTKRVSMEFDVTDESGITADRIRSMEIEAIQSAAKELTEEKGVTTPYYCVGYSIIGYTLDGYKMINLESHRGEKATVELIATFLPNVVVEGLYSVVDICSLSVSNLTLEPIAAMNAIIPKEIRLINIALVDIGAGTSDIAISKDGSIIAYAMATIAGDEITEEIIKSYFVDFDTAERIKQECCSGIGTLSNKTGTVYRDIFGLERSITPEEFAEKIQPSVDTLAETICVNILEANGGESPAAVFLIGGGSLVKGLAKAVSDRLGVPIERVALGSNENLKNIDTGEHKLGAEFITPLGIGVTGAMNKGYDFTVITLNDKAIRLFNTSAISIFELLTTAGYKSSEILGQSGHSLTYFLNGKRKFIRGGNFEPAKIYLGGKPASLNTPISGGDKVKFIPAVCGNHAKQALKEAVLPPDEPIPDELGVTVNGNKAEWDYEIQNLDKIETFIENDAPIITTQTYPAADNAVANTTGEITQPAELTPTPTPPITTAVPDLSEPKASLFDIHVTLNGETVHLPESEDDMPHQLFELFSHVADMDFTNPKGDYVTDINGVHAGFNDILADGDDVVIKWR